MKYLYFTLFVILNCHVCFSTPCIKVKVNGYWHNNSTWDLNRVPTIGDTIIIPADKMITITDDRHLNGSVYLKVYGKLSFQNNNSTLNLGEGSTVIVYSNGQVLGGGSASQKLRIGNTAVFKGNEPPVDGPQMATASSSGFQPFTETALPVTFAGFTVSRKNSNCALIQWSTSEEINAYMYEVQRSFNGSDWNTIAYVSAAGNSNALNHYSYTDKNITVPVSHYRIRQVDMDGRFTYTDIKCFKTETNVEAKLNIASVEGKILLQFPKEIKGSLVVRMVSLSGQVMEQQILNQPAGQVILQSKSNIKGNFIISVSNGDHINVARQVIL